MKIYSALAIVVAVLTAEPVLRAQQCYTPITSWTGSYSLNTLSGNGTVPCGNGGECTTNQAAAANVKTTSSGASCSEAVWAGNDVVTTAALNDTDTSYGCGDGQPPQIQTLIGS